MQTLAFNTGRRKTLRLPCFFAVFRGLGAKNVHIIDKKGLYFLLKICKLAWESAYFAKN